MIYIPVNVLNCNKTTSAYRLVLGLGSDSLFCDSHMIVTFRSETLAWLGIGVGTVDAWNTVGVRVIGRG